MLRQFDEEEVSRTAEKSTLMKDEDKASCHSCIAYHVYGQLSKLDAVQMPPPTSL